MNTLELTILPQKNLLPVVLSALEAYAGQCFEDSREVNHIILAAEEAINNVLSYSLTGYLESITVTADCAGGEFTLCVLDKGLPGNYESTLQGEERLGLTIMRNTMDVVAEENLGNNGRCQKMVKYCSRIPNFSKQVDTESPRIENAQITVRTPKYEEMQEISRLIYGEYGLTYVNDIVYYPDRLYAAVEKDVIHSSVAVDENGNVAGHHAVFQWENLPGVWEGGMAVVNSAYRNSGIFGKMMQRSNAYIEAIQAPLFIGACTTHHPYTQKLRLKNGSMPCGFSFHASPPEMLSDTFRKEEDFLSEAYAGIPRNRKAKTVCLPKELQAVAEWIYGNMQLERTVLTEDSAPASEPTQSTLAFRNHLRIGSITFSHLGADCIQRFTEDLRQLKSRGAEMATVYIPIDKPGTATLYEAAKAEGFFFTGILPATGYGDILMMQKIFNHIIHYENIVTTGIFTELLETIRSFDPDQK